MGGCWVTHCTMNNFFQAILVKQVHPFSLHNRQLSGSPQLGAAPQEPLSTTHQGLRM